MRREEIARHPLAIIGAVIATASAVVFITLLIAVLAGLFENPYAGLVVFVAIPILFVIGLLLIPIGVRLERRKGMLDPNAPVEWPVLDFRKAQVRRTTLLISLLTCVNVVIILLAGYGSLHWMESPSFCGQVCHTPMHPQFTSWQGAVHSRVACASCHIGEGAGGFVHAKLSGVRQLIDVATGSYPRPIPPGAHMQPGAQAKTCAGCHEPGRIVGDRVRVIREYAEDEANTETMTVLQMHLGSSTASEHAIHWHADPAVRVEYVATDDERQTIPYVRVTNAGGQIKEYRTDDASAEVAQAPGRRTMDCIDCHNTVGHPISATPERAIDEAIAAAKVSRDLPFSRREALTLLKASYPSEDDGVRAIERGLKTFYESQGRSTDQQVLARTIAGLQDVYRRNVFPTMGVTWGTYPDNKGHLTSTGCFRCHDDQHKASDGSTISGDCEFCHRQIERP